MQRKRIPLEKERGDPKRRSEGRVNEKVTQPQKGPVSLHQGRVHIGLLVIVICKEVLTLRSSVETGLCYGETGFTLHRFGTNR
jgi:hypothetical protein